MFALFAAVLAALHALWILALLVSFIGLFRARRRSLYRASAITFNSLVFFTIGSYFYFGYCLFTQWEQLLWLKGDPSRAYYGDFVVHYLDTVGIAVYASMVTGVLIVIAALGAGWQFYRRVEWTPWRLVGAIIPVALLVFIAVFAVSIARNSSTRPQYFAPVAERGVRSGEIMAIEDGQIILRSTHPSIHPVVRYSAETQVRVLNEAGQYEARSASAITPGMYAIVTIDAWPFDKQPVYRIDVLPAITSEGSAQ